MDMTRLGKLELEFKFCSAACSFPLYLASLLVFILLLIPSALFSVALSTKRPVNEQTGWVDHVLQLPSQPPSHQLMHLVLHLTRS